MATCRSLLLASILASGSGLVANQASADKACYGTITAISVEADGGVAISTVGDPAVSADDRVAFAHTWVCNVSATAASTGPKPITPKACEKIQALLLTALLSKRPMTFWFWG